jgi:hypothetical protein
MLKPQRLGTILMLGFVLAACGSGGKEEERQPSRPANDSVSRDMFRPIEKARSVEGTTMQHKQDMDRAINAQEESTAQ